MIFIYKLHLMIVLTFILYRRILIKKKKKEKEQKEPVYQHPNGITQDSRKKKIRNPIKIRRRESRKAALVSEARGE